MRLLIGIIFSFISLSVSSQSFEDELQRLNSIQTSYGTTSLMYANQLAYMAIEYCDTTYHNYFNQLSKLLVSNHESVRDNYGIDSDEYRSVLIYLSYSYTYGKFYDKVNLDYKPLVRVLLLSLKDRIDDVQYNKHEFLSLISNVYQEDKDFDNVIKWRSKAIEISRRTNSVDEFFYDNEYLAGAYLNKGKIQLFKETATTLFKDDNISLGQKQMAFVFFLNQILLSNSDLYEESFRFLLGQYQGLYGLDISQQSLLYIIPAKKGDLEFLKLFEEVLIDNRPVSLKDQFNYYYYVSLFLALDAKDQKSSIMYAHKAIDIMEKIGTCDSRFLDNGMPYYSILALRYREDNNYSKDIEYLIKGLEDIEKCRGINNEAYYSIAKLIASEYDVYFADPNNSINYAKKALASAKSFCGDNSNLYLDAAIITIGILRHLNNYNEARELADNCLAIIQSNPILEDYLPSIYNQIALIANNQSQIEVALDYFNMAIGSARSINDRISYIVNREGMLSEWGLDLGTDYDLNELDSIMINNPDISDRTKFEYYNLLGVHYSNIDPTIAKKYYDKADIYSSILTPDRLVFFRLNQFLSEPNYYKQYSLLLDAIDIYESHHLQDGQLLADIYNKMAYYYEDVNDIEASMNYYKKALELYGAVDVELTNPSFLACLNNLGLLRSDVDMLRMVYEIRRDFLLDSSHELRISLMNLISAYLTHGNVEKADLLYHEGGGVFFSGSDENIYEYSFLGARITFASGDAAKAIKQLNTLEHYLDKFPHYKLTHYETLLDWERSAGYDVFATWTKLLELHKDRIITKLLFYSNKEKKNLIPYFQSIVRDLIKDGVDDPRFQSLIADYSLFSKGLLLTTDQQVQKILRKDKTAQLLYNEGKTKRVQRSNIQSDSILIAKLDREINLIDKQLLDRVGTNDLDRFLSFSSSDLLKTLRNKQMAIDFIAAEFDEVEHYYAIIYKDNNIYFIPLFIDEEMDIYEKMGDSGINAMSRPLFGKLIWGKLLPYMNSCTDIFFSPDGLLNRFAIELLPILEDSIPDTSFHRVLRFNKEMLDGINKRISTKEIVAFGNIDYDKAVLNEGSRSPWKWEQLDATAVELQTIQNVYSKSHLSFYEKIDASESNFKKMDNKEINIFHIATHGFYISDIDLQMSKNGLYDDYYIKRVYESGGQGRGGLLLSGANHSWHVSLPDSIEDGILSSEEIESLSFVNLELVVLSACETGLGESNIDGVWGLQRAFRIAGAKRQIVSLLKVDDDKTQEFMSELHRNISKTNDVYESFKNSQRYMHNKYKNNPRFWASFILLE